MDVPDNYYAILGVPIDADSDTLKRAYRQLARRYHPDLAGTEGAVHMKRINRAYDVLSDPEKRLNYDTIIGGVIDFRKSGLTRPRPVERKFNLSDEIEFSGLSIFSTKGPFRTGPVLHSRLGVISSLSGVETKNDFCIAAASLDGKGLLWLEDTAQTPTSFTTDTALTIESLRELRFSATGNLLAGWGRLGLHVWDTSSGSLLWSYPLTQRAVSAHNSLDVVLKDGPGETQEVWIALPLLKEDPRAPRALGVRGTDIVKHVIGTPNDALSDPLVCAEDNIEKRQFWAIRLRTLSQDTKTLQTLSCAHVPGESNEMVIMRRWDLVAPVRKLFAGKTQPQISTSLQAGLCADCTPPYAFTPDSRTLAFVYAGKMIRFYDTGTGTYSEVNSGSMGASSRLAISPDAQWVAVAREDSEVNEGVIDVWSIAQDHIIQKLYHPWQISALHFANKQLIVALTDGTIQVWKQEPVAF
jgi:WD40 repeat protein